MTVGVGLVLASASPARARLLAELVDDFEVCPVDLDETRHPRENPRDYAKRLALAKGRLGADRRPDRAVLAADTVVSHGQTLIPKTEDVDTARAVLKKMAGRRHRVVTAVALVMPDGKISARVSESRVKIGRLDDGELSNYLGGGDWRGKSGCFSLEGEAARFIKEVWGSPSGIEGLPLYETYGMLRGNGLLRSKRPDGVRSTAGS